MECPRETGGSPTAVRSLSSAGEGGSPAGTKAPPKRPELGPRRILHAGEGPLDRAEGPDADPETPGFSSSLPAGIKRSALERAEGPFSADLGERPFGRG
eukprot:11153541-Alexandrium_andersonii.AAC.2